MMIYFEDEDVISSEMLDMMNKAAEAIPDALSMIPKRIFFMEKFST